MIILPFYLYERNNINNELKKEKQIQIAGNNARRLWEIIESPINRGWHASLDIIINNINNSIGNSTTHSIIIDLVPSNKDEIVLLELLDIWGYTYGDSSKNNVYWSPIMLRLRKVYYEYFPVPLNPEEKHEKTKTFNPDRHDEDIFEFLYWQGHNKSWIWQPPGSVNAPILESKTSLNYFLKILCNYNEKGGNNVMSDKHKYWVVGANFDGDDMSDIFFQRGYWELGWDEKDQPLFAQKRDEIKKGDRIAIKSMLGQGSKSIQVKGIGIITDIGDDKRLYINWKLTNMNRQVDSGGCYASIHGPYDIVEKGKFNEWLGSIFTL